ncbi:MAG: RNA polymerase sigma factor [Rubripirellula sp.]
MTGQHERKRTGENAGSDASSWSGKSESVEAIWRHFGDQFRRRARTRLRQYGLTGQAESMDICNDVMAEMTRGFNANGVTPDDALAYVLRAIDNQVLDTFRRLARQCRDFRRNEPVSVDELPVVNQGHSPSQIALHREVIARIQALLNDEDALAVSMMLENRGWQEIGESLGVKPDTVRMRVRRALERVREEIGFREGDSDG